jgi:hypothetical protein
LANVMKMDTTTMTVDGLTEVAESYVAERVGAEKWIVLMQPVLVRTRGSVHRGRRA